MPTGRFHFTSAIHFLMVNLSRYITIRLDLFGGIVIFFSALLAVISRENVSAGIVGLAVSYALRVNLWTFGKFQKILQMQINAKKSF